MKRVATILLAAGLLCAVASQAAAAPTSSDPKTAAGDAAAWLAARVNAAGFIPAAGDATKPDYSSSTQAVVALASAGIGREKVDALVAYLGHHVDDAVSPSGVDDPGSLANLILAVRAVGLDATAFGTPATNLVSRLVATQQDTGKDAGLFGSADATYDGVFREGLALLALHAAGVANASGVAWLEAQQCDNHLWTAYRADRKAACPAVDPTAFTGPDTNSTALAMLGLAAQGASTPAADGATALDAVRNAGGGWGFLARGDQATDANSTGVVLEALRTVNGSVDGRGTTALLALQLGCSAPASDRGALAFQPADDGTLEPNLLATAQAVPALAGVAVPVVAATIASGVPTPCVVTAGSTTTTVAVAPGSTAPPATVAPAAELPRTGSASGALLLTGGFTLTAGLTLLVAGRRRSRTSPAR